MMGKRRHAKEAMMKRTSTMETARMMTSRPRQTMIKVITNGPFIAIILKKNIKSMRKMNNISTIINIIDSMISNINIDINSIWNNNTLDVSINKNKIHNNIIRIK